MKIPAPSNRKPEHASATLVFVVLLGIMMILVTVELRVLAQLRRELKLLEQKQIQRLNPPPPASSESK